MPQHMCSSSCCLHMKQPCQHWPPDIANAILQFLPSQKKQGKIASFSPFWPSQSWKMTLGGTPLSTSMRKKNMAEVPGTNLAILPPRSWTKASRLDSSARIMGQGPKGGKMLQQAHLRDTGSEKKWRKKNNSSFEVVSTGLLNLVTNK